MKTVLIHIFKVSEPAVALMLPLISLSLSPLVAVAVTVLTMMIQVPPTPPLVTLSVRWWNVTLMVIPQVSNFCLYFHKVHIRSLSQFIWSTLGKKPPLSPWIRTKYCSIVVLLWGKKCVGRLKKDISPVCKQLPPKDIVKRKNKNRCCWAKLVH